MQRDKAWKVFQYPCLGVYAFLNLPIVNAPQYDEVLQHIKDGATFLDLGCCFGQIIRKLVFDGAPGENLTGSELKPAFVELGFELFRDRQKLSATFTIGDFFEADVGGLQGQLFDYIYGGAFFHLFTWEEQVEAISRAVSLLKQKPGSMILGWQTGAEIAKSRIHDTARSGKIFSHNEYSLEKLVAEVSDKLEVELSVEVRIVGRRTMVSPQDGGDWLYLSFCITKV